MMNKKNTETKQDTEQYLGNNIGFLSKLKGNVRAVNQYRKLFNTLCERCKAKVMKNPKMQLTEYCDKCQNKVTWRIEKIKELIGISK